jgi:dTMP kinase
MFDGQRQLIQPNLTLLFDLPGEIAESRRQSVRVADKFEKLNLGFFEKVRAEYLRRAKDAPDRFRIIDANQDKDLVWKELEKIAISL